MPRRALKIRPSPFWTCLSIAMYSAACLLPAMPPIFGSEPIKGWECLASLMYFIPAWWANPAYFISLILYWCRCTRTAAAFGAIAAMLACSFEFMAIPNDGFLKAVSEQEIGCYIWVAGLQIHACNLALEVWQNHRRQREELEANLARAAD